VLGSHYGTERGIVFDTGIETRDSRPIGLIGDAQTNTTPGYLRSYASRFPPGVSMFADPDAQKFTRFEIAPSTMRFEPVVNEEAGLARNTAALAISCGVAMRPSGLRASVS
jgi:hypothetical protein